MLSSDKFSESFYRFFPKPSEQNTEKKDPLQALLSDIFSNTSYTINKTFTAYTFGPGHFKTWAGTSEQMEKFRQQIELICTNLTPETVEQAFCDIFPKIGFSLTAPVEKIELEGHSVYSSDRGALLISLEPDLSEDMLNALIEQAPDMILCLD